MQKFFVFCTQLIRNRVSIEQSFENKILFNCNPQLSQCHKIQFCSRHVFTPENNSPHCGCDSFVFCKSKLKLFGKLRHVDAIYYRLLNGTETSFNAEAILQPFKCNIDFGKFSLISSFILRIRVGFCGLTHVFFFYEFKHLFLSFDSIIFTIFMHMIRWRM